MKLRREKSFLLWAGVWALAVFAPACGSDGNGQDELLCLNEELAAGQYMLTVQKQDIDDKCAAGLLAGFLAGSYGPVTLPSFGALPEDTTMDLPLVGKVPVHLSVEGGAIRITLVEEPAIGEYLGCQIEGNLVGTLCPISQSELQATVKFTVNQLAGTCTPIQVGCTITVSASGVQQPG